MEDKIEVAKITVKMKNKKTIELSVEEAKELHTLLDGMFGARYIPSQPIYIERYRYPWSGPWYTTTWTSAGASVSSSSGVSLMCSSK
jgi:hypothetical protein